MDDSNWNPDEMWTPSDEDEVDDTPPTEEEIAEEMEWGEWQDAPR
jgi:hypothetical protein